MVDGVEGCRNIEETETRDLLMRDGRNKFMMGTRIDEQSFSKEVGIGSSLCCLLGRDCNRYIVWSLMLVGKYLVILEVVKGES